MKSKMTLQQRLIFPIALLGVITLLSNILAVFGINNVHSNAGAISWTNTWSAKPSWRRSAAP